MRLDLRFIILLLCLSCQAEQPQAEQPAAAPAPVAATAPAGSRPPGGVWVKAAYLDALARTHSPKQVAALGLAAGITAFAINRSGRPDEELSVEAIEDNRRGRRYALLPQTSGQAFRLSQGVDSAADGTRLELTYAPRQTDTLLEISQYNQANRLVAATYYRRISFQPTHDSAASALTQGLARAARVAVVAGRYRGVDAGGKPVAVSFSPDGEVEGLASWRQYGVRLLFAGPGAKTDLLTFDDFGRGPEQEVAYRLTRDTLRLYSLRIGPYHSPLPDQVTHTLVRRR